MNTDRLIVKPSPENEAILKAADELRVFRGSPGYQLFLDLLRDKRAKNYEALLTARSSDELLSQQGYALALCDVERMLDEQLVSADQIAKRVDEQAARRRAQALASSGQAPNDWSRHRAERLPAR